MSSCYITWYITKVVYNMLYNRWVLLYSICYITLCRVLYKGWESLHSICYIAMPSCYIAYPRLLYNEGVNNMLINTPLLLTRPTRLLCGPGQASLFMLISIRLGPRRQRVPESRGPEPAEPRRRLGGKLASTRFIGFQIRAWSRHSHDDPPSRRASWMCRCLERERGLSRVR